VAIARQPAGQEPGPSASVSRDWRDVYAFRLVLTDLLVLGWVVFGAQIAWFGYGTTNVAFRADTGALAISYSAVSIGLIAVWMWVLGIYGSRGYRVLGTGPEEYKRIANASFRLFGIVAIVGFLGHIDFARGYILIAFPLGIAVLVFSRWIWRQWLGAQRIRGGYSSRVVLVGSEESSLRIAKELSKHFVAGYHVVGACVPQGMPGGTLRGTDIRVFGGLGDINEALRLAEADTVVVTSGAEITAERMRELSWSLEPGRQHLVVVPSLTDIGGPRIHTRPVAGLPLIHVETPTYEGRKKFAKRAFDLIGSGLLLVLASVPLILLALLVKLTSDGPVFYWQERVGLDGKTFHMLKFRSMQVNADARLAELLAAQGSGQAPLFKVRNDPRLTRPGAFLRKYSLDELPQLINVWRGDMSLVGPRPQRESEVALYDLAARRRLIVQPGMTGLWQVSGRSSLSWEDAIRLDLYYVENWSVAGDIVILWRTIKAVVAPGQNAF
jgi:exopolysaccharide biosynthesis polyprenyl glycosylphosphotransferase